MIFNVRKRYRIDLREMDNEFGKWFSLSGKLMPDLIRDGRILGRVLENALVELFENFELSDTPEYDIVLNGIARVEVKSTTGTGGINFQPSNMIGAGRSYNYEAHKQKTEELDYYLAIDRQELPIIELYCIPSEIENVSKINTRGNMKGSFTKNEWDQHKKQFGGK